MAEFRPVWLLRLPSHVICIRPQNPSGAFTELKLPHMSHTLADEDGTIAYLSTMAKIFLRDAEFTLHERDWVIYFVRFAMLFWAAVKLYGHKSPIADILDAARQRLSAKCPHLFAQIDLDDCLTALQQLLDQVSRDSVACSVKQDLKHMLQAVDDPEKVRLDDSQVTENGKLESQKRRWAAGLWARRVDVSFPKLITGTFEAMLRYHFKKDCTCAVLQSSQLLQRHPCCSHVTLYLPTASVTG